VVEKKRGKKQWEMDDEEEREREEELEEHIRKSYEQ
jgi:hypothetical protein